MPKGADLHNHLSGAIYAESYIKWAADKGLCVNQTTMTLVTCDPTGNQVPMSAALTNSVLYRQLIDAVVDAQLDTVRTKRSRSLL